MDSVAGRGQLARQWLGHLEQAGTTGKEVAGRRTNCDSYDTLALSQSGYIHRSCSQHAAFYSKLLTRLLIPADMTTTLAVCS